MKTIMINLCGPLQSYGMKKINGYVRTNLQPTQTAIAGMIACAGGIQRNDPRLKEIEESITITSKAYELPRYIGDLREKKNPPDIMIDYQSTRGTESDPKWKIQKVPDFSIKEYIADTYFRVWISGDDEKIKQYALWLDNPEWPLYLGKKCCIPSIPIFCLEENKHIFGEPEES